MKMQSKKKIWTAIIIIYVLLMAQILLFKNFSPLQLLDFNRVINRTANFIPFYSIRLYYFNGHISNIFVSTLNVVGNIVIFIPIGIYLQIYSNINENIWWSFNKNILFCSFNIFLCSLTIEVIQYVFGIGIADVDDIILNTIGGILGIFICRFLYKIFKDDEKVKTAIICLVLISVAICFSIIIYAKANGHKLIIF